MDGAVYVIFAVYGVVIGSFINVVIYRLPKGLTLGGRSMCTACGRVIKPYDLVPLLSWVVLRGKCRHCGARISPRYFVVEAVVGALFLLAAWRCSLPVSVVFALFFAALTAVFVIDLETQTIPDSINVAIAVLAVAAFVVRRDSAVDYLIGAVCVSVPLLALAVVTKGFGGGDVKLFAAIGLLMGWKLTVFAAFLSFVLGGATSGLLLALGRVGRKTRIPFGPFICVAAVLSAAFGDRFLAWYLGFLLGY